MTSTDPEHLDEAPGGAEAMLERLLMTEHGRNDGEDDAWPFGRERKR